MSTEIKAASAQRAPSASIEKAQEQVIAPAVDVFENANELLVVADLPGVAQDQMTINFDKGRLTISGKRAAPDWNARLVEAANASFRRTFLVPQGIDADKITADLSAGVLTVHLPKHSSIKPRRIAINAA